MKTPLDWAAAGFLGSNLLCLAVLLFSLLPIARESNKKLIEIEAGLRSNRKALAIQSAAIIENQKAILRLHEGEL